MRLVERWWSLSGSERGCKGRWDEWHSGMASDGVVRRVCGLGVFLGLWSWLLVREFEITLFL